MNKSDQKERASLLGSTGTTTFHAQSQIAQALDAPGGRFAAEDKSVTSGSEASVQYPRQPEGSPWAGDPVGQEPPFPVDISAMDPVGTFAEIEASLAGVVSSALAVKDEAIVGPCPRYRLGGSGRFSGSHSRSLPSAARGACASHSPNGRQEMEPAEMVTQLTGLDALIADPDLLAEAKLEPHNLWLYFEQSDFPYLFPDTLPELTAHWCCIHRDMVKLAYLCEKPGKREAVLAKLAVREAAMLKQIERIGARA